ncbi:glucosidase 2 subunit beta-like [Olea europaea var. sylvestris]|uniref:glucosidase 2 subunit beta-like n=1 Tax=Olea europaea var. sylvestris TaxID=158386 RepID=UPI000C1D2E3E|nr:glucosidase 2 subunit beta-like [Olea europaea var. sylvestris]
MTNLRIESAILLFCVMLMNGICRSASVPSKDKLVGVSPEDEKYYRGWSSSGTIKCKDGSRKFSKSQFNDDFCDCPDGSDEPGTSACPNGRFYCKNAGHVPLFLYSSRVNDGLCDCCDGSDEYDGKIKCPNTCWEAGKVARDKLKKKITTYEEGLIIRRREIEQAKLAIAKEVAELSKLKDQEKILKGLVEQLKERKEQIEKAEEKERLRKEKEELERKEDEESKLKQSKTEENAGSIGEPEKNDIHDKIGLLDDSPPLQDIVEDNHKSVGDPEISDKSNGVEQVKEASLQDTEQNEGDSTVDGKAGLDTGNQEKDGLEDSESLSREELGRRIASRWTGEMNEQQTKEVDTSKDDDPQNHDETLDDTHDEEYSGYDSEDVEQRYDDDDDDDTEDQSEEYGGEDLEDSSSSYKPESDDELQVSDITGMDSQSWLEKIQQTVRSIFQAVNFLQTPADISDAARVRKEYDESSSKLSKIQSRISSLSQKLKYDFGKEKEFYSFYGQCFESKQNKYVYKICPFKQATQVEGHSTTRLGSWEKFDESYESMLFSNGDHCWNGPDRSIKVKLRCGLKNEVIDIGEPSRCEYVALLSTPALCVEDKLKELEVKLETMNEEQPQGHDEL